MSSVYSLNILYSYSAALTQSDDKIISISTVHFPRIPTVSATLVRWRSASSNQMRLAAQMRTNDFSNHAIIKHTALVFQTH